jgi:SAM-dependent methyltransferase
MKSQYIHEEKTHNFRAAEKILPSVIEKYQIKSVLDVGTGIGTWLKVCNDLGIKDFLGVDGNWVDRSMLKIPDKYFLEFDLTNKLILKRKYDLVICLEVAEHIPSNYANVFIENLVNHSDIILFSAAIPGQEGQNHLNEQNLSYWIEKFEKFGFSCNDFIRDFFWNDTEIEWWYRQNAFIFSKNKIDPIYTKHIIPNQYIHPELFNKKNEINNKILKDLNSYKNDLKNPFFCLKMFLRSILKR